MKCIYYDCDFDILKLKDKWGINGKYFSYIQEKGTIYFWVKYFFIYVSGGTLYSAKYYMNCQYGYAL